MSEIYQAAMDKGLEGVVACSTGISTIQDTTLSYRGYTIEDLAENSSFEEVVFLLWNGRLPSFEELKAFKKELSSHMLIQPAIINVLKSLPYKDVHPMSWLRTAVSVMSLWDSESGLKCRSHDANYCRGIYATAKMPTLLGLFQRIRTGQPVVPPHADRSVAWNVLHVMLGIEPDKETERMMDQALILHADHELNCSTFTARVTASSLSDIYSAIVSAIGALKGPLHGGANTEVMRMLKDIGTVERAREWVREALQNKEKIMGFGHRVYKNGDPRAKILKELSRQLTQKIGEPHWFEMSEIIDDTVQAEKGLMPNVDFYSATVYYSMGIPMDLFTPLFAVARTSGWVAHALEQYSNNRIYRPRGQWVGLKDLKWTPLSNRQVAENSENLSHRWECQCMKQKRQEKEKLILGNAS